MIKRIEILEAARAWGLRPDVSELYALLAHPTLDSLALSEGLKKWRDLSWFLVDDPAAWALSTLPNLTHMHVRAVERLEEAAVEDELRKRIQSTPALKQADEGVIPHILPKGPEDVPDNLEGLRYIVLGAECAAGGLASAHSESLGLARGRDKPRLQTSVAGADQGIEPSQR